MNAKQIILAIRFKVKPGKKEEFRNLLFTLADKMSKEANFVNSIIHDDLEQPDDILIYEIWNGTQRSWLEEEFPKPYRKDYENVLSEMLEDRIVSWLVPTGEWGSRITSVSR
ncbi:putative quinol monooxygenase [Paenibacillus gansuensis]|uniref:Quinol monooxygenase n=1 Tax=Paenibacillus gansuensis TaxID=306542 RepID=A0ABW5PCP5_9BACL